MALLMPLHVLSLLSLSCITGLQYELRIESSEINQMGRYYFKIENSNIRKEFNDASTIFVTRFVLSDPIPDIKIRWERNTGYLLQKIITIRGMETNETYMCDYVTYGSELVHQCTRRKGLDWKIEFSTSESIKGFIVRVENNESESTTVLQKNIKIYAGYRRRYLMYFSTEYRTITRIRMNKLGYYIILTNLSKGLKYGCTDPRKGSGNYSCTLLKRLKYELNIENSEINQMRAMYFTIDPSLRAKWIYFKGSSTMFKKIVDLPETLGNFTIKWDRKEEMLSSKIITMRCMENNETYMCDYVTDGSEWVHQCTRRKGLNWKLEFTTFKSTDGFGVEVEASGGKSMTVPWRNIKKYNYHYVEIYFVYFSSEYQIITSIKTNKIGLYNIILTNLLDGLIYGCTYPYPISAGFSFTLVKRIKYELKIKGSGINQHETRHFRIAHSGSNYWTPFKGSSTLFKKIVDLPCNIHDIKIEWIKNAKEISSKSITMKDLNINAIYECNCIVSGSGRFYQCISTEELNWKMVLETSDLPNNVMVTIRQGKSTTSHQLKNDAHDTEKYFAYFLYNSETLQDIKIEFTRNIPKLSIITLYNFQNGTSLVPSIVYHCKPIILNSTDYFRSCKWTKQDTTGTPTIPMTAYGIGVGVTLTVLLISIAVMCLIRHHRRAKAKVRAHQKQGVQIEMRAVRTTAKAPEISHHSSESDDHTYAECIDIFADGANLENIYSIPD